MKKVKLISVILFLIIIFFSNSAVYASEIKYIDKTNGIITTSDNLFENIDKVFPGDIYSESAIIKNSSDNNIQIYLKVKQLDMSEYVNEYELDLLKKVNLKIDINSNALKKNIYSGNMKAEEMHNYILLGEFEKNYEGTLNFTIEVPKNLDNNYAGLDLKTQWVLGVKELNKENMNNEKNVLDLFDNPNTGDNIIFFIIVLILSIISIIILFIYFKKNRN